MPKPPVHPTGANIIPFPVKKIDSQPGVDGVELEKNIRTLGWQTVALYSLLLLPTLMLIGYSMTSGKPVSHLIEQTWHFQYLFANGHSSHIVRILSDGGIYIVIGAAAFLYYRGYQRLKSETIPSPTAQDSVFRTILTWTAGAALALMAVVPFHSRDIYGYINRGAQQAFYDLNPYIFTVEDLPNWHQDLMFHDHWINNPCPYGFFFALLAKGICLLSGHHFFASFLLFKGFNVLTHLATTWAVFAASRRWQHPRPWFNAYLYGLNPLMLLQMIGNGHNDLLLGLTLMASVVMITDRERSWMALPMLMLSVMTKYAAIAALPWLLSYSLKQKDWRGLALGSLLSIAGFGLLALPFVSDLQAFPWDRMVDNAGLTQHSLHSMLCRTVFYLAKGFPAMAPWVEPARLGFKGALYVIALILYSDLWLRAIRRPDGLTPGKLAAGVASGMMLLLLVASSKFNVWYLGMVFPLLLLLDETARLRRFGLLLAGVQLLAFTALENLHIGNVLFLLVLPWVITVWTQRKYSHSNESQ